MKGELGLKKKELPPLTLRKNFLWTFVGNTVYVSAQWGIIVFLAKFGTPLDVGRLTLGLAITAPIIMLLRFQLRGVQATDQRHMYSLSHYFTLRILMMGVALFFILSISASLGYGGEALLVILIVGGFKVIESLSDIFYGCMQKYERLDKVSQSMILRALLGLTFFSLLYFMTRSLPLALVGLSIGWLIVLTLNDVSVAKRLEKFGFLFNWKELFKLAILSLPLGVVLSLVSLNTNIPRYLVDRYIGTEALGFFGALYYVTTAFKQVVQALGQASTPKLARFFLEDKRAFLKLFLKLLVVVVFLGILSMLFSLFFGKYFLRFVYSGEYARYYGEFNILMAGASIGFIAIILGYTMTAQRVFRAQPYLFLSITTLTFTLGVYLIPRMGIRGAAYTVLASNLFQLLGSASLVTFTVIDRKGRLIR